MAGPPQVLRNHSVHSLDDVPDDTQRWHTHADMLRPLDGLGEVRLVRVDDRLPGSIEPVPHRRKLGVTVDVVLAAVII
eukprot:COSAG02_NODE_37417_length_442_cov_0.900875_1_plen_77_part_10